MTVMPERERLLTPAEVANLFRVHPKTVSRWVQSGKLSAVRTLGGHRRYRASEVYALLEESGNPVETAVPGRDLPMTMVTTADFVPSVASK